MQCTNTDLNIKLHCDILMAGEGEEGERAVYGSFKFVALYFVTGLNLCMS